MTERDPRNNEQVTKRTTQVIYTAKGWLTSFLNKDDTEELDPRLKTLKHLSGAAQKLGDGVGAVSFLGIRNSEERQLFFEVLGREIGLMLAYPDDYFLLHRATKLDDRYRDQIMEVISSPWQPDPKKISGNITLQRHIFNAARETSNFVKRDVNQKASSMPLFPVAFLNELAKVYKQNPLPVMTNKFSVHSISLERVDETDKKTIKPFEDLKRDIRSAHRRRSK